MNMSEIKEMAKPFGIKTSGMRKAELIKEIQMREGNFPCFGTARDYCDQTNCCFKEDCIEMMNN